MNIQINVCINIYVQYSYSMLLYLIDKKKIAASPYKKVSILYTFIIAIF